MKWEDILKDEYNKEYFLNLKNFLEQEYGKYTVFPKKSDIFKSLKLTEYEDTRVVILGQDPYHDDNQANGLAFSVNDGIKLPPSLVNIYKEIESEYQCKVNRRGNLEYLARQGVLLLNTVLTVRAHNANSHKDMGWEIFTDKIIEKLNEREDPVIFVLWGNNAIKKEKLINKGRHYVLTAAHPSPLSAYRGFFGCNHFKKINEILRYLNKEEIKWT
ncbi:uracil-DNA glycosylase [Sneathia vaginalis]|uniref:Uracil-DNA glycosylase n=1 Tax=Sneathia vaginalis TaxID=187101 RepID=A0A0E3ZA10_9FUSO|nr:uracil-DNA glycosylase [Sneathia vaginalis]AKC95336.1 uracil-DNA glycosylase [Sneathia vaginalis]